MDTNFDEVLKAVKVAKPQDRKYLRVGEEVLKELQKAPRKEIVKVGDLYGIPVYLDPQMEPNDWKLEPFPELLVPDWIKKP